MSDSNTVWQWQDPERRYAGRIQDTTWDKQRLLIFLLHENGVPRLRIQLLLKICRGFEVTMAQLNRKMDFWKLKVYGNRDQSQNTATFPASARFDSLDALRESILGFDKDGLRHFRANSDDDLEAALSSIRNSCEPESDVKAIVSLILTSDHIGANAHVVLADIGQLLYACNLFFDARYMFCLSYECLVGRADAGYMSLAACERDRVRVSTSHRERQAISKGEHLFRLTLGCVHSASSCSASCLMYLKVVRDDIRATPGTAVPVDAQRFENSLPSRMKSSGSKRWILCHSDLNWRWSASEHPYRVMEVAGILKSWIENLHLESGRVWVVLRDCLKLLEDCCNTTVCPMGKYVSDVGDPDEFQRDSRILACFFTTSYLRRVSLQNSTTKTILAEVIRLEKITSFNLSIRLYSVFAIWIVESATNFTSGSVAAHPAKALLEAAQSIMGIKPAERAIKFLELDRKVWYNNYYIDYSTPELWKRVYIMQTARLMANVLIRLQKPPPKNYADPVLGKRDRSWATSTASYESAREMQDLARNIRKRQKSGEVLPDILRLSDRMSNMTIDSNLSFGAVTGYPPKIPSMYSLSDVSNSHILSDLPEEHEKLPDLVSIHEIST